MPELYILNQNKSVSNTCSETISTDFEEKKSSCCSKSKLIEDWTARAHVKVYSNLFMISLKIFFDYLSNSFDNLSNFEKREVSEQERKFFD